MAVSIAASLDDNAYEYDAQTKSLGEKVGAINLWIRVGRAVDKEMIGRDRLDEMKRMVSEQTILVLKNVSKRPGDKLNGPTEKNGRDN